MIDSLPQWLRRPILEAATWKILCSMTVFALALFLVFIWIRRIRRLTRGPAQIPRIMRWLTVPAVLALSISLSHYVIDRQINLTGLLSDIESLATTLLLYVAAAWATALTCRLLAESIIASPNDLGLPVLGVVAGLGVGSLALALASQSTVENLLGGVAIFADRPFRVKDAIRFNDLNGVVESIGPRSTRIRATDGTLTTVPNADIARAYVNNLSARRNFLFEHRVNLPTGANVSQTIALLATLRKLLEEHQAIEKSGGLPHVRLTALEHDAGAIHFFAHVAVRNEEEFLQIQEDLLLRIMELLSENTKTSTI